MIIEALTLFFLIFTSLIGIISLIRLLAAWVFERNIQDKAVIVLPVKGHEERIEWIVRSLLSEREHRKVAVLDLGMDSETLEITSKLAGTHTSLVLLDRDGVLDYLEQKSDKNG